MEAPFVGQFRMTIDELTAAAGWHLRVRRNRYLGLIHAAYAVIGALGVYSLSIDEPRDNFLPVVGISLCLGHFGYWFGVRPHRIRTALEKVFLQSSAHDEMVSWELFAERLVVVGANGFGNLAVGRTV